VLKYYVCFVLISKLGHLCDIRVIKNPFPSQSHKNSPWLDTQIPRFSCSIYIYSQVQTCKYIHVYIINPVIITLTHICWCYTNKLQVPYKISTTKFRESLNLASFTQHTNPPQLPGHAESPHPRCNHHICLTSKKRWFFSLFRD